MATLLYSLGRFSYRRPWRVLIVWLVLLGGILGGGLALGGETQESFAIPGTESQQAIDRLEAVFPEAAGASAQLVVRTPEGDSVHDDPYSTAIDEITEELGTIDGVAAAISPFSEYASDAVSGDESTAIITAQFTEQSSSVTDATLEEVKQLASLAEDAGMQIGFGGQVYQDVEYGITPTEIIGVVFAGLVLLVTFGSLLAAGMPLLAALTGIGVAIGVVMGVSAFTTISSATPLLALMIGLAVGIDYALFILSRHRQQLANGVPAEESAATAVATAGSAVVFAGVTVIIALLGLLVVGIPFLSAMGISAAFAVLLAVLVAVTFLPALLGLAGNRLAPKPGSRAHRRAVHDASADAPAQSFGARWVSLVLKAPVVAVLVVVGILGTLAIPAFSLNLALPSGASEPEGSTAREAYDLISEGFGEGHNGPLVVLVDITQTITFMDDLDAIGDELRELDGVDYVGQGLPNPSLDTAIIQVIPDTGPDDPVTTALVEKIRALAPDIENDYGTPIAVTGTTAVQIDISTRLNNALVPFGLVVVGLSIVLLMMVFRSVFVPIKAAAGFLLSVLASFGVVVAIFQWGWFADAFHIVPGPILSFMPILLMAVLFGLAMDYEVFLVSGMRENWVHTGDARRAIVQGFSGAARVVTAAALIMFFVFAAFVPEGAGVIKVIALGLAVGIVVDAFLVRMTLVPAAMALVGAGAWWMPRWLGRLLPNVDIEGDKLHSHREEVEWASAHSGDAITARSLVAGVHGSSVGPLSMNVPPGSLVLVTGDLAQRRLFAATVAGRLEPRAGRAQVLGHPLGSEASRVARLVALSEIGAEGQAEGRLAWAELLEERVRLTSPWHRVFSARGRAAAWVDRVNSVLERPMAADAPLDRLTSLQRSVATASLALAERAPVVILNIVDSLPAAEHSAFLAAVARLAPASTAIVVAAGSALPGPDDDARPLVRLNLASAPAIPETASTGIASTNREGAQP